MDHWWTRKECWIARIEGALVLGVREGSTWRVLAPELGLNLIIRNPRLKTWVSAGPVVEVVLRQQLGGDMPALGHTTPEQASDERIRVPGDSSTSE